MRFLCSTEIQIKNAPKGISSHIGKKEARGDALKRKRGHKG